LQFACSIVHSLQQGRARTLQTAVCSVQA
jgi:hypothetical protein